MNLNVDVAIAGAGVGGAVLALALARQGLTVAVVEQARQFAPIYRGEFLQPRSLEILYELGLREAIDQVTTPVYETRMRRSDGHLLGVVDYRALVGPIKEGRNGHHRALQGAVLSALEQQPGARLLMGTRVTGLSRAPGGTVAGLETTRGPISARLTVGADGQHSVVRKALGLPTREFRYPGEPLAVTVELDTAPPPSVDFVFGVGESGLVFPLPGNRARLYLVISDEQFAAMRSMPDHGLSVLKERLSHLLPQFRSGIERISDMAAVQRVPCWYLRAAQWVADGAALLGDAVHCVSPTRGQGMNLAIQDAESLASLVATLPRAQTPTAKELLPYQRRRQWQADFIQRDAGRVHRLLLARNPIVSLGRDLWLGNIKRAPHTMAAILRMYAGTVRPPVWYDHLFVTAAVLFPPLDRWVAQTWGRTLKPLD